MRIGLFLFLDAGGNEQEKGALKHKEGRNWRGGQVGTGGGTMNHIDHLATAVAAAAATRKGGLEEVTPSAPCTSGGWFMWSAAGYPFYAVFDCADHPVDIDPFAVWYQISCPSCPEETNIQPVVECSEDSIDEGGGYEYGDDDNGRGGGGYYLVDDLEIHTFPPTVAITPPPTPVGLESSNCAEVVVTGTVFPGKYVSLGELNEGRPVFYGEDKGEKTVLAFFVEQGSRRQRRALRDTEEEGVGGGEGHYPLSGLASPAKEKDPETEGLLAGRGMDNMQDQRSLLTCYSGGRWVIYKDKQFPVSIALDCALHPADITTLWMNKDCSICSTEATTPAATITCSGAADYSESNLDIGRGSTEIEEEGGKLSIGEAVGIGAGTTLGILFIATAIFFCVSRKNTDEAAGGGSRAAAGGLGQGMIPPPASSGRQEQLATTQLVVATAIDTAIPMQQAK
ncbi:unnamed protein product [Discosporangium mesarthrocarpum]